MDFIRDTRYKLLRNSMEYLEIGLREFHNVKDIDYKGFQPALGNLSIAIELMLKTIIAHNAFASLFSNLPLNFKLYLTYPELLKDDKMKRALEINFLHSSFNSVDLTECVGIFNVIHSESKNELSGYFKMLNAVRNASVHYIIPSFQKYDLQKVAMLAITLFKIIDSDKKLYNGYLYSLTESDNEFIKSFSNERIEIVKSKIEAAKDKAHKTVKVILDTNDLNAYIGVCPVCKNDCILSGESQVYFDESVGEPFLSFSADSLDCEQCGLSLTDFEELKLANVETEYERNNDYDKWVFDNYGDPSDY